MRLLARNVLLHISWNQIIYRKRFICFKCLKMKAGCCLRDIDEAELEIKCQMESIKDDKEELAKLRKFIEEVEGEECGKT